MYLLVGQGYMELENPEAVVSDNSGQMVDATATLAVGDQHILYPVNIKAHDAEKTNSKRRRNGTKSGQQSGVCGVNRGVLTEASLPTRTPGHAKLLIVNVQRNICPEYFPVHSPLPPYGLFMLLHDINFKFCSVLTTVGSLGTECTSSLLACLLLSTLVSIVAMSEYMWYWYQHKHSHHYQSYNMFEHTWHGRSPVVCCLCVNK